MVSLALALTMWGKIAVEQRVKASAMMATITVMNTNDSGAGSLRQAIADAASGDTIDFAAGVAGTITLTTGELAINKNLTINGPGAKVLTVSGNNASRVLRIDLGSTVTINGLTIANGNGAGAGIGGLGGGILNEGALTITGCSVSDSSSGSNGGGISNRNTLTITNSALSNNLSSKGGAIDNQGLLAVSNSTISNNSARVNGGGLINSSPDFNLRFVTLTNCTVTGNRAGVAGGGISGFSHETLKNTMVAGNFSGATPNDIQGTIESASHSLIGDAGSSGGISDGVNGNIVGVGGSGTRDITTILNTFLGDYGGQTKTHLLVCGSPAINAGDNTLAAPLTTDQRGAARVVNTTVDIGAVEMQSHVTNTNDSGAGSLRQTIADAASGGFIDIDPCLMGTITLTTGELAISKNLAINGPGANKLTVSGNNASRIFSINSTNTVTISGLTISNGNGSGSILNGRGGGILNRGTLTINNSAISNNSSGQGGGIDNFLFTNLTLNSCTISNNSVGGISSGGGINNSGAMTIANCTISNNSAGNKGGGIASNGTLTVTNCTITGNLAGLSSGGILVSGNQTLRNTIVAGNFGDGGATPNDLDLGTVDTASHNLIGNAATSGGITDGVNGNIVGVGGVGTRNINTILNTTLSDNGGSTKTHALVCGSAAVDAGDNSFTSALDQRGLPRIVEGDSEATATVDIGAFELQNACPAIAPQIVSIQKNSSLMGATIASVNDAEDAEDSLAVEVNGGSSAMVNGVTVSMISVAANGSVTANVSADCNASSAMFTLSVTDSDMQTVEAMLVVTVTASNAPMIMCPANITVNNDPGQCSAVVMFNSTAMDDCDPAITPVCSPPSGSTFLKGITTVTCTATDSDGNMSQCSFAVTVNDAQAPSITCPSNIVMAAARPGDATVIVSYAAPAASDFCDTPTVVCTPPSGAAFPTGTTTVTCTASDTSGNSTSCSFTVAVFDVCLQDDSNSNAVLLWNSQTGDYRYCCNGAAIVGRGTVSRQGNIFKLTHTAGDRRVNASLDASQNKGSASLQHPLGTSKCPILDRDTRNNSCQCASS
jgi:hypothetical protein